jgi:hypothetical protein
MIARTKPSNVDAVPTGELEESDVDGSEKKLVA